MEVIINGRKYQWESNFLNEVYQTTQSKWSKKREDYFCFETIGNTKCFIKRSEVGFEGKSIFEKILDKETQSIPKVYSVSEVFENNKKVQYLITEFIEGDTLDVALNNGVHVNLTSFADDLISGVKFLNDLGYWHSDLNADNIFISTSGKTYIIDIDSCIENKYRPTYISNKPGALTTLSNQLGSYALKYYKAHLNKSSDFSFSDIVGTNLNYFQTIFLIFQVKYFLDQKKLNSNLIWKKSTFRGLKVEDEIRNINQTYADSVFMSGLKITLNREIVQRLLNHIINETIKKAPDINLVKKSQELNNLKVKYNKLDKKASELQVNNKKLVQQIDDLSSKRSKVSGVTWFWGVAAIAAIIFCIYNYNRFEYANSQYYNELDSKGKFKKLYNAQKDETENYRVYKNRYKSLKNAFPDLTFYGGIKYDNRKSYYGYYYGDNKSKVYFTLKHPIYFQSVKIDAKGRGRMNAYIYDINGNRICKASNSEITDGIEYFYFNCNLDEGKYYITSDSGISLGYVSSNRDLYPISNNILSITGSNYSNVNYMNFFEWKYKLYLKD